MNKDKPGPTGDFPEGKLNPDDEGGLNIAVSHEIRPSGAAVVRIDFGSPTAWVAMGADQALAFASIIVKHAMELKRSPYSDNIEYKGH